MSWVQQHWTLTFIVAVVALAVCVGALAWYVATERRHEEPWEDWQAEPVTDADADQLIAEWHDGDRYRRCWRPELHTKTLHGANIDCPIAEHWTDEPQERTITPDVWDQWWAGVDGLERECMLVHDWLVREERLWAELKAETRELCAA